MSATSATRSHSSRTEVRRRQRTTKENVLATSGSVATRLAVDAKVVAVSTRVGSQSPATIVAEVNNTATARTSITVRRIATIGVASISAAELGCDFRRAYPYAATGRARCHTT